MIESEFGGRSAAKVLIAFVEEMVSLHLPVSLAHEMTPADFHLTLREDEDLLAADVLRAFDGFQAISTGPGSDADLINDAFGRFLADSFTDEKELGQYLTPSEVVSFMVNLALEELSEDERKSLAEGNFDEFGQVLDPSCGVGSFLAEFVRSAHAELEGSFGPLPEWSSLAARELVAGIDKSERMVRLATANLATFGSSATRLHLANGLAREDQDGEISDALCGKVGLILTNPPFGATFEADEIRAYRIASAWSTRRPRAVDSELLFMERYIDWLRPGGQLLAVVPDSILTNKGIFADLRKGLAPDIEVRTVISLPSVTFAAAGTTTKTSILHLRKSSAAPVPARFAVCHDIGYSVSTRGSQRSKSYHSSGDLPSLLELLRTGTSNDKVVTKNIDEAGRWDAGYHASPAAALIQQAVSMGRAVGVRELANLASERQDPRRSGAETFSYIEISDVDGQQVFVGSKSVRCADAPSRARQRVRAGDVLVSTVRPERRSIGVVPPWLDGAICTTGFAVLRPNGVDGIALAALLKSDLVTEQLMQNNVGIAYPAIDAECLPEVYLPLAVDDIESLNSLSEQMRSKLIELRQIDGQLQTAVLQAGPGTSG
ncbi:MULTISPECIES: N-6 DNA methylase [unclassified Arthrobacter]|uniref:N-6 DNA methylase n=1 Tax=unclassified Arthrobacter TaxID=235627 RepID=UPI001C8493B5|nr:N-6 DNA methylase [Arthrobacter sp. MAHUQ-56]MBX7442917.1 N-6 DNA methylase [Arthrobacter sp. MAHUQ-56]